WTGWLDECHSGTFANRIRREVTKGGACTCRASFAMDSFPDLPLTTLTGLGPPQQVAGDPPSAPRMAPETLRPWALTEDAEDDAHGEVAKIRVPLSPMMPAWSRFALGALSLVASGAVGLLLGR